MVGGSSRSTRMPTRPSHEFTTSNVFAVGWGEWGTGPNTYGPWTIHPWDRTYSGTITPSFRSRKGKSILPENPYSMSLSVHWAKSDYYYSYSLGQYGHYLGGTQTWTYFSDPGNLSQAATSQLVTDLRNRAAQRLGAQASAVRVNLGQFFGERKETAHMIANTATRIVEAARALRRADLKAFTRALSLTRHKFGGGWQRTIREEFKRIQKTPFDKRLANHWLEYVYGWRPLLSDIHSAAELLADHVEFPKKPHGIFRSSASGSGKESFIDSRSGSGHLTTDTFTNFSARVRCKASYVMDSEAKSVLAQTGITNPLLLAWELLPYSFVVDWFLPVGNYLESLTEFDGFSLHSEMTSQLIEQRAFNQLGVYNEPGYYAISARECGGHVRKLVSYSRSNTLPQRTLSFRSPIGGAPLERAVTALSLLRQLFGR